MSSDSAEPSNLDGAREQGLVRREAAVDRQERAVQAREAAQDEVRSRRLELREANAHLLIAKLEADQKKDEALGSGKRQDEFLAMLAHELRNPLAPISNAVALLAHADCTLAMLPRIHGIIARQVDHLVRLVDQLLDVSRVTQGRVVLQKRQVAVADVVGQAIEMHRGLIETQHHKLTLDLPAEPVLVHGDAMRLVQVLGNLLHNAAKYTPEGGAIAVEVRQLGASVAIKITDTGVGISPETLPLVFDLFSQADNSLARSQGGLGIGLTVVRSMVQLHGGTVEAYSRGADQGSEFVVKLPVLAQTAVPLAPAPQTSPATAGDRVLLIEDNADAAATMAMVLELSGYAVDIAPDGPTGLEQIARLRPGAVLCDIGLPGMSGYEVARRVRQAGSDSAPVMIAMTGYGTAADRALAWEAGFDHHITKPTNVPALLELLAQALHRPVGPAAA